MTINDHDGHITIELRGKIIYDSKADEGYSVEQIVARAAKALDEPVWWLDQAPIPNDKKE